MVRITMEFKIDSTTLYGILQRESLERAIKVASLRQLNDSEEWNSDKNFNLDKIENRCIKNKLFNCRFYTRV